MVKLNRLGLFESRRDFIHCSPESDGLRQLENLVSLGTLSYRIVSYVSVGVSCLGNTDLAFIASALMDDSVSRTLTQFT